MEPEPEQPTTQNTQDPFATSKLFTEALSQQSSHYIQSKLLSLPKEAQDLKKLDLRHMCDTVVRELQVVEREAAYDYVKVSEQLQGLGSELVVADGIMQQLQNVLYNFKDHLEEIKCQMTSLQEKSNKINTSLSNKKKVQTMLSTFIESAVLQKELIDAICTAQVNQNYVIYIKQLIKKLNFLNQNSIAPDSKAVKELQPQLQKLKARASVRLRQFMLDQISLLKKPKTNIQIVQKSVLGKYKVFTQFFKDQNPQIYTEICNNYREVMAKIYVSNYKVYLNQIQKLQIQLYTKTDQIVPLEPQHLRTFLTQTKPTNFNQEKRSIFALMGRDRIIDQNQSSDVILFNVASQKGQKFTLEQTFKSVNKSLIDGVIHQIIFTSEFFNLRSEGAIQIFGPIFRPSIQTFLDHLKRAVSNTYDMYSILLILAINEKNKKILSERGCTALDSYFSGVQFLLWPKFQQLFQFHLRPLQSCPLQNFKRIQKSATSKVLIDRFVDMMVSVYRLYINFPNNVLMLQKRLSALRKTFLDLVNKGKAQYQRESEGLCYYLSVLEQVHHACTSDPVVSSFKEFHVYQLDLEKQIGSFADKLISIYLKEFFPALDAFMRKYSKQEGAITQEATLSIQGTVDLKSLEGVLNEVSTQSVGGKLTKLLDFCQRHHGGYSLKSLIRKFSSIFTRYYGQIYKYAKSNHPDAASTMLQTHGMIKQLKNTFSSYMNSIQPQDSLDNLSNLQHNHQRQLLAQVKQLFSRGLQKLQMAQTRQIGIAELKKLIEQYRQQQYLRGYIAILKTLKANTHSATKEHQILVISIVSQTYRQKLLDTMDKPPSLIKTAFRLVEIIHSYFSDHSPTVQQACARALLDLNKYCLADQDTETVYSIIYAPLISILKSGVDKSSQGTASACLNELINYNRKTGGDQLLKRLSPELLTAIFKVNSEYHQLFQAILGMLQSQQLLFLDGKVVSFLSKMKSVIDGTRDTQSTNTTNLNAYMCKVNVCKMIEKIGKLLPMPEKQKLFELRIPEALQQAARHRIIQVQMAAGKALKVWKGQIIDDSPPAKRLSSLEDKRNNKKLQRSKSKDERSRAENQLTFMKQDLQKLVKGGWGASNRAKNYVKRGSGVGGGYVSQAQRSPQSKSGGKSHKEHFQELRQFIKKGAQDNKNIDRFVGIVGQQFQRANKSPETRAKAPEVRNRSPQARTKSPSRPSAKKISASPSGDDGGQIGFVEDQGDQMAFEPRQQRQRSQPKKTKVTKVMDEPDRILEAPVIKSRFDDIGMSESQAQQLMAQERALFQQGKKMNINFAQVSQDDKSIKQPTQKLSSPPVIQTISLQSNGHIYTPQQPSAEVKPPKKAKAQTIPTFKGLSQTQLGDLVEEYNLSQVSQNLNDVLSQSDIKNFQQSNYQLMDSRILEPTQGKSQINIVKDLLAQKKQKRSSLSKFMRKEPEPDLQIRQPQPLRNMPIDISKQNVDHPAVSLNFTQSQQSKVKTSNQRQDIQFTLNPKEKFSNFKESLHPPEKQIQQQIAMSQYEESFPARDQPLPFIMPKVAPISQIPLRHSLVPPIIEEKQSPPDSGLGKANFSRPDFIHEFNTQSRYRKEQPPENKTDYQNMIRNPPKIQNNETSRFKGSKITQKSYQERSKLTEKQAEAENLSTEWLNIIDLIQGNEHNLAYEQVLTMDDPLYFLRLMLLSKVPLKKLSPDVFRKTWSKFMQIYSQKFIEVLTVGVLSEGNDLNLLSKCLSVQQLQEGMLGLFQLSGSSKGKLSYKAATLYNDIDRQLHPE